MGSEQILLAGLKKHSRNWLMAFNCIPRTMRLMFVCGRFVHSYKSYLWNHAATYCLRTHGERIASSCLGENVQNAALRPPLGQRRTVEKLWRDFFADPLSWWDSREEKVNAKYPDFKHKRSKDSLWLNSRLKPSWVEAELAAMAPGTVQVDVYTWDKRIERFAKAGEIKKTMELIERMQREGLNPGKFTFVPVLNACSSLRALEEGKHIHLQILQTGHESDSYVASSLIDMYANCGSIDDAQTVFNNMPKPNLVVWNAMILGYVRCRQGQKALDLFRQMQDEGMDPDPFTFVGTLKACASVAALEEGRRIHKLITERGWDSQHFVGNSLVDMYTKCGSLADAWTTFNNMPTRDVVSWNSIILGHVKCGQGWKALELSQRMLGEGVEPDPGTFVGLLNACASIGLLEEGCCIHRQILRKGWESNIFLGSSIIDMYAKCGSIEDARRVFERIPVRDVFSWNAMILGYVKFGQGQKALDLSRQMVVEGVDPDSVTLVGMLNACASLALLEEGQHVHEQIIQRGWESDILVGNSLIDMYAKCGRIQDAWSIFNKMPTRNVVSWNAIILGHVKCGQGQKALNLFRQMRQEGIDPNAGTFVGVLNACASVAALEEGCCVHDLISRSSWEFDLFVGNSLIDMYVKCGSIENAKVVFRKMPTRDVVSWNSMLGGYAKHGHAEEALEHFERMCQEGETMSGVTFLLLLSACSHGGLVNEGLHYFSSMSSVYSICRTVDHYASLVDLLGRAGQLHQAEDMIKMMSCAPNASVWMSLLGSCRVHGNGDIGERVAKQVLYFDSYDAAGYLLLSSIYASSSKVGLQGKLAKHVQSTQS